MKALAFAWRSLVRQPARAALGILGVAAVGALLFDMLLLSDGLVTSMREMLERTGFDIRVTATGELPRGRPPHRQRVGASPRRSRSCRRWSAALAIRFADARLTGAAGAERAGGATTTSPDRVGLEAVGGDGPQPWTVLRGRDATALERGGGEPGAGRRDLACRDRRPAAAARALPVAVARVLPPALVHVVGIAEFPLALDRHVIGSSMATLDAACGGNRADEADAVLVRSAGDVDAAAAALRRVRPDLRADDQRTGGRPAAADGFTYFQQISAVLTTVTLGFALLLITVLLTVSVNQRLGEIAALRALGFSRGARGGRRAVRVGAHRRARRRAVAAAGRRASPAGSTAS